MIKISTFKPPPFTLLYNGGGEFLIHKGYVIHAGTGAEIPVKLNGEELTDAWLEEGSKIQLNSGESVFVKVIHTSKTNTRRYSLVDLISAEIVTSDGEQDDTTVYIELASVEYDDGSYNPDINQKLNSDIYLAILGDGEI